MQTIGQIFREAREQQGRTVLEAAAATRIKPTQISEMERDDFHSIVAPIYGRGFIKIYAEFLGLDPAPLLQRYNEKYVTAARPTLTPQEESAASGRRRFGASPAAPARPSPAPAEGTAPSAETAPARRVQVLRIPRKAITQALLMTAAAVLLAVGLWAGVRALKARAARRASRAAAAVVAVPRPAEDTAAIMEAPPLPYLDPGARPEPGAQAMP